MSKESTEQLFLSASALRDIICELIASSIEIHRGSRESSEDAYDRPIGDPTDDEVDDFLFCNPLYDAETVEQLTDPGLLGFNYPKAKLSRAALDEFREQTSSWAQTNEWLGADMVPYHVYLQTQEPDESAIWLPGQTIEQTWFSNSPNALLLAADLLKSGRLLSELDWRSFEKLIGELLEREGYQVEVTRGSKDGGVDVIASIQDPNIGLIRSIWQAKKYSLSNKVGLAEVRELSGLVARPNVTKGIVVTTSHLTRGALEWIKKDTYKLSVKDKDEVEAWVMRNA